MMTSNHDEIVKNIEKYLGIGNMKDYFENC